MGLKLMQDDNRYKGTLTPISNAEQLKVKHMTFTKDAIDKIYSIMESGVKRNNQEFLIREIVFSNEDYLKLDKKRRYKAELMGPIQINGYIDLVTFILGQMEMIFDLTSIKYENDGVHISDIKALVFPHGEYSYKTIND